ncbi:MAG TPA: hypothetical protein VKA86_06585 [Candidatus Krumholzibacteria bacterium]|nr:hypothetical protein [Candidatus Krumholzibacteria bacterium]
MAKKIPTGRARVGDVLAEPVVHGEGQMLLVAGTELGEQHLEMLRQRGVLLVTVVDEDGPPTTPTPGTLDPDELKRIVLEEGRWFGEARKDPILSEVFRWVVSSRTGGAADA